MIRHTKADKFLTDLRKPNGMVRLVELHAETPAGTRSGIGEIEWRDGKYRIEWLLSHEVALSGVMEAFIKEWNGPKLYTKVDRWRMQGVTANGLHLEFDVYPPRSSQITNSPFIRFKFETHVLKVVEPEVDPEEEAEFAARMVMYGLDLPGSSASPKEVLHHAVFLGIESPLRRQRQTVTTIVNDFHGEMEGIKNDTWVWEKDGMTFALIQREEGLHAYLRLKNPRHPLEEQERIFTAFFNTIGFTHGFRAFPAAREVCHDLTVVKCWIANLDKLAGTSAASLGDRTSMSDCDAMVVAGFDFFLSGSALVSRFWNLHGILCEAHEGSVIRRSDLLALCTVFDGLIGCLFDHHRLKASTRKSERAEEFSAAKLAVSEWLQAKHVASGSKMDSSWDRFIGYFKSCGYVRPEEKIRAVSDFYGFPWDGDMAEIFRIWKQQRNPLAHGSTRDLNDDGVKSMFAAWSRLTGAINRFMLAEMGYTGWFCYSVMEPGLQEIQVRTAAQQQVAMDSATPVLGQEPENSEP